MSDTTSGHKSLSVRVTPFQNKRPLFNPTIFGSAKKSRTTDKKREETQSSSFSGSPRSIHLRSTPSMSEKITKLNMDRTNSTSSVEDTNHSYLLRSGPYYSWKDRFQMVKPQRRHVPVVKPKILVREEPDDVSQSMNRIRKPIENHWISFAHLRKSILPRKEKDPRPRGWLELGERMRNEKAVFSESNVGKIKKTRHRLHESSSRVPQLVEPAYNLSAVPQFKFNSDSKISVAEEITKQIIVPENYGYSFSKPNTKFSGCRTLQPKMLTSLYYFSEPSCMRKTELDSEDEKSEVKLLLMPEESGNTQEKLEITDLTAEKTSNTESAQQPSLFSDIVKKQSNPSTWMCDVCMVQNDLSLKKCCACENLNPNLSDNDANLEPFATTTPPQSETNLPSSEGPQSFFVDFMKKQKSTWSCNECFVNNESSCTTCLACETPNPNMPKETKAAPKILSGVVEEKETVPREDKEKIRKSITSLDSKSENTTSSFSFSQKNEISVASKKPPHTFLLGAGSDSKVASSFQFGGTNDSQGDSQAPAPSFQFGGNTDSKDTPKVLEPSFTFSGTTDSKDIPKGIQASFQFGGTSQSNEISVPGFQFGATNESKVAPIEAAPCFLFGAANNSKDAPKMVAPGFQFGATNESKDSPKAVPPNFQFGATTEPKDVSFKFGADVSKAPATMGISSFNFSATNEPKKTPTAKPSFYFGSSSSTSIFKAAEPDKKAPGFSFGGTSDKNKNSNNSGFSFGSQPNLTNSGQQTASIFGNGNTTTSFSFENKNSNKPFSFGEASQPKTAGSIFSAAPNTSLFGASQSKPSFGQSNSQLAFPHANPANFSFGTTFSQPTAESQGFGTSNNTNGSSLFGNSQPLNNSTFDQTNNQPPAFGSHGAAPNFSFGQTQDNFSSQPSSQDNMFSINSQSSGTPQTTRKFARARRRQQRK